MKIKKAFLIAVACVSACSVVPFSTAVTNDFSITANAETGEIIKYENFTVKKYSDYIEIANFDNFATETTDIVIPSEIDGLPVTTIGKEAFNGCYKLTNIVIPNSVTKICRSAFQDCKKLEKMIIPKNVSEIENCAFQGCTKLTEITFAESDTKIKIGNGVFYGCTSLKKIFIPKNVDNIPDAHNNVFENCTSLESIEVDKNNENYASRDGVLFNKDFTTLIKYPINKEGTSYAIPESVKKMSSRAFHKCSNLISIEIPNSVTSIGSYAFASCSGITEFEISKNVTHIEAGAFANCSGLTKITIKNPKCIIVSSSYTISNTAEYSESSTIVDNIVFNGTIYCYEDSTAMAYAEKNGYKYESMGVAPETEPTTDDITESTTNNVEVSSILGDANGDGVVDIADAVAISAYVSDSEKNAIDEPKWIENGDVQSKGNGLNANDSLMIQQYLAGIVSDLNS